MEFNKKNQKRPTNHKGSAIAYGLVIVAIISIILVSVIQFIASQMKYASHVEVKEKAFHIAEGGIYFYRWYLAHVIEGKNQNEIDNFWTNGQPLGVAETYEKDYLDDNYDVIGRYEIDVNFPTVGDYNVVEVVSTGYTLEKPETRRTVKARLRRSIWSDYNVISDDPICFDESWTLNAKVMGNNGVHIDGVANNIVYAGVSSYNDNGDGRHDNYPNRSGVWTLKSNESEVFKRGKKFPVPKKDFSGITSYLQAIKSRSQSGGASNNCAGTGCYFDSTALGRHIILKNNGTMDVCIVNEVSGGNNENEPKKYKHWNSFQTSNSCSGSNYKKTFTLPNNGAIFVENNIWLEGTIDNKRLTFAAATLAGSSTPSIFVGLGGANIRYTNYDGKDVLALIAEQDVVILNCAPENLRIDAALIAQKGEFKKLSYNDKCCGGGCQINKNNVDIFGSVITKGGLGFSFHKDCPKNPNMTRKITYDNNLHRYPPPFFPADSFYYVDLWEEM